MDAQTLFDSTRDRLRKHEGEYIKICQAAPEISYSWLTKLAHGQIKNPTVTSLQQLIEALDAYEAANDSPAAPQATEA